MGNVGLFSMAEACALLSAPLVLNAIRGLLDSHIAFMVDTSSVGSTSSWVFSWSKKGSAWGLGSTTWVVTTLTILTWELRVVTTQVVDPRPQNRAPFWTTRKDPQRCRPDKTCINHPCYVRVWINQVLHPELLSQWFHPIEWKLKVKSCCHQLVSIPTHNLKVYAALGG